MNIRDTQIALSQALLKLLEIKNSQAIREIDRQWEIQIAITVLSKISQVLENHE